MALLRHTVSWGTAGLACLGLVLSGCVLGTAAGPVRTGELAGPLSDIKSLDGLKISIGSKNFSENIILGKMAVTLLSSDGADVIDLTNIPGSSAARQAHLEGQVAEMWEYTGTVWITYLGHDKPIPDETEQYLALRADVRLVDSRVGTGCVLTCPLQW